MFELIGHLPYEKAADLGVEGRKAGYFFFQNRLNLQLLKAVEKLRISEISKQLCIKATEKLHSFSVFLF